MTKKFNPITGQWEDDTQPLNTSSQGKYNPVSGQWENNGVPLASSSVLGGNKTNIFKKETTSSLGTIQSPIMDTAPKYSVMDILGIGQYSSAKFADTLLETGNPIQAFSSAIQEASKTLSSTYKASVFGPQHETENTVPERVSYKDIIKKRAPDFAKNYPLSTSILGFVGDVAFDPLTYVSFGAETGARLAGQKLSNKGIDVVRDLYKISEDGFRYTIKNPQGLERIGVIGIDELNNLKHIKDLTTLSKGAINGDQAALRQLNTIINAQTKGFKGKLTDVSELTPYERNWTVEGNFNNLARQNISLIQQGGDTGVFLNIPFSNKRITVVPPQAIDTVLDKLGIKKVTDGIVERLRESPAITAFTRNFPLENEQEYLKIRETLWGQQNIVDHSLMSSISDFAALPKESRQTLAELAIRIDENLLQKITTNNNLPLSSRTISTTRIRALNDALRNKQITITEFNVFGNFISTHDLLAQQEAVSNLFKQVNDSGIFFSQEAMGKTTFTNIHTTNTDLDLAVLYALRVKSSGYKQAQQQFDAGLELLYNTGTIIKGKPVVTIPKEVQKDINFIGTSVFSDKLSQAQHPVMDAFGIFNNVWKPLAYSVRPFVATKQYVGNTLQAFSKIGFSAFKTFDPRSVIDGIVMLADNSAFAKYIPNQLLDGLQKFSTPTGKMIYAIDKFQPNLVAGYQMVNRLGERITGPQLVQELMEKNIYQKGLDILSLDKTKNLRLQIAKSNGFVSFQKEKWQEGFFTFLKESLPWINLPSYVENINRVSTYINARRLGLNVDNAAKLTQKALFDYAHGTTAFENTFMKRVAPFYTFQRFAVPLIASLVKEPGKASNLNKITKEFFEVYHLFSNGQQLTDSQRQVLPNYLMEQPNVYDGITQTGESKKGIFHTFNSYVFTDWLSMLQTDITGNIDIPKTVQKMTLAQITPLLKVPLELLYKKNFFTDQPINTGGRISSGQYVDFYENNLPDLAKHLMSYEVRTDNQTGEKKGYVNPYITYTMQSFAPFIMDYVNIGKDDLNGREFAMKFLTGTGTVKLDFQKEQHYRIKEWQDQIKQLQFDLRKAMASGKQNVINDDQIKLQQLINKIGGVANLNVQ